MSFVLASADFSCCTPADRTIIYDKLSNSNWKKLYEDADDKHTVWVNTMSRGATKDESMEITKQDFYACCKTNCLPRVVFEWGYINTPETAKNTTRYPEPEKIL